MHRYPQPDDGAHLPAPFSGWVVGMFATARPRLLVLALAALLSLLVLVPATTAGAAPPSRLSEARITPADQALPTGLAPADRSADGWSSRGHPEFGSNAQVWNGGEFVGWCASDNARSARLNGDTTGPSAFSVRTVSAGEAFVPGPTHDPGSPTHDPGASTREPGPPTRHPSPGGAAGGQVARDSIAAQDTATVAAILHRWTPGAIAGGEVGGEQFTQHEIAAAVHYAVAALQVDGFEDGQDQLPSHLKDLAARMTEEARRMAEVVEDPFGEEEEVDHEED